MTCTFFRLQTQCRDDEFEHEGQVFSLDYRTVSGDVSLPENAFRTQDFLPHGKTFLKFASHRNYSENAFGAQDFLLSLSEFLKMSRHRYYGEEKRFKYFLTSFKA
jgi:hypothetical protein